MDCDYCAFQQTQLKDTLSELEGAAEQFEQAKQQRDKKARQEAEGKIQQIANKALKIEPHLPYLWYEANASELRNFIRDAWRRSLSLASNAVPEAFRFTPDNSAIAHMPALSFLVHIPFRLQKPYISKDDRDFHVLDNPLRREKIFQAPMVAATGWKGALRAALWQMGYKKDDEVILRLLGNPHTSQEGQAGRLHFYSTFFNKATIEVINPHSRQAGVGERGPILMECVPQGTTGDLVLLCVPFGPIEQSEGERCAEVARDLEVLTQGIQAMLTTYGFGAKTSSGFGTVEDRLAGKGTLALRAELPGLAGSTGAESESKHREPNLPRYLESPIRLHEDFRQMGGTLKSEPEYELFVKSRDGTYRKQDKQLYEKAQKWWDREGRQLAEATTYAPVLEPATTQALQVTTTQFDTLSKLVDSAKDAAAHLRTGGGA
jgi:CRISPR-associated protein Cmr2